jgi:phosphoribosylamine---glycine ligase
MLYKLSMKVLVIGQGGREHAIVKALSRSTSVTEVHALPGNPGMAKEATCHNIKWQNFEAITLLCKEIGISYVFIGPEDPLVGGLSDHLRDAGILVVGPSAEAAQLEGSKIFAKQFMNEAKVSTAPFRVVTSREEVFQAKDIFTPPYVLKVDGLAAGKGVYICKTVDDLMRSADEIFEQKLFGKEGERALLEQFLPGDEVSFLVVTNGHEFEVLPLAQDHKRLLDRDEGPNTGGMGTVAPIALADSLMKQIEHEIITPCIQLLDHKQLVYRGILYFGLMLTKHGPQVLEFNCRFGDPETQVILPIIANDIGEYFLNVARGQIEKIKSNGLYSCCVVLAAEGYPANPTKGTPIEGSPLAETAQSYFIHAGTKLSGENWTVNGGRVIGAIGNGSTLKEAIERAYKQSELVNWKGLQKRSDIGQKQV